jgi:hypothetical protein
MPLVDTELLFEREGGEPYRCATVTRSITYTASGFTYFDHGLQAVDDQGGHVTVTPNPDDMNAWTFEAVETVQPIETATDPEYGHFVIEVQALPVMYTRPDQAIQEQPVDEFTTNDTVYLLQPPPCVSDYVRFEAIGPSGFHWESPEAVFCRSYSVSVFEIGTALAVGDYVVTAKNEGTGDQIAQWQFSVSH